MFRRSFRQHRYQELPDDTSESESSVSEKKPSSSLSSSSLPSPPISSPASSEGMFQCRIPDGVAPGATFGVNAGDLYVRVRCPENCHPGQTIQLKIPLNATRCEDGLDVQQPPFPRRGRSRSRSRFPMRRGGNGGPSSLSRSLSSSRMRLFSFSTSQEVATFIPRSDPSAYMVRVPEVARSGDEFEVFVEGNNVPMKVKLPRGARPGKRIRYVPPITLAPSGPPAPNPTQESSRPPPPPPPSSPPPSPPPSQPPSPSPPPRAPSRPDSSPGETRNPISPPNRQRHASTSVDDQQSRQSTPSADFGATLQPRGRTFSTESLDQPNNSSSGHRALEFEAVVPQGVEPGQSFAIAANGTRLLVKCPHDAHPGQKIRFRISSALLNQCEQSNVTKIQLQYVDNANGWMRIVRAEDQRFQWVRVDGTTKDVASIGSNNESLAIDQKGFCRYINTSAKKLCFIQANEAMVVSKLKRNQRRIVSYKDIVSTQVKRLEEKLSWFQSICNKLRIPWEEGHIQIHIRRDFLIEDSMHAVLGMTPEDLRRTWRFHFIGEAGLEAGGLTRDWFQNISEKIFDPSCGLFRSCMSNQLCLEINPYSKACCGSGHLNYFRFAGRVIGRALLDRQLVSSGHLATYLYKHFLGWPITLDDMKHLDEDFLKSLKQLMEMADTARNGQDSCSGVSDLCLDFTIIQDVMGEKKQVELVEGGNLIAVQNDNVAEFVEACIKYKTMDSVREQLYELLAGFYEVIPEPLLTVFDVQEFELVLCGLPKIDIQDWKSHTEYTGIFENCIDTASPSILPLPCRWFWEVVTEFDEEMRARLLQFVTGTAGVPSQGFAALQSHDGNIRNFTIEGVDRESFMYPRSHTCFNRLDLPTYTSKSELKECLTVAILETSRLGFGFE